MGSRTGQMFGEQTLIHRRYRLLSHTSGIRWAVGRLGRDLDTMSSADRCSCTVYLFRPSGGVSGRVAQYPDHEDEDLPASADRGDAPRGFMRCSTTIRMWRYSRYRSDDSGEMVADKSTKDKYDLRRRWAKLTMATRERAHHPLQQRRRRLRPPLTLTQMRQDGCSGSRRCYQGIRLGRYADSGGL